MIAEELLTIADETEEQTPLPEGWRWTKLADLCSFIRGVSFDKSLESHSPLDGYLPILRAGNISDRLEIEKDLLWVPSTSVTPYQKLQIKDIAVCMSSGSLSVVGKTAQLNEEFEGSVGAFCGIIRPKNLAQARFLAHWLKSPYYEAWRNSQTRGANIQNLRFSEYESILIPLPPTIEEQIRISTLLDEQMEAVGQARLAVEDQLKAAKLLSHAFLRSVFDKEEAQGWEKRKLGEICEIQLGKMLSPKSKIGDSPRPYLRNANVQWARFDLNHIAHMDFSESEAKKFELKFGDLLVCEGGEPGRSAVWREEIKPCFYQKALHRLRPLHDAICPEFIMYRLWFSANEGEFLDSHAQTTIAHLPAIRLLELPVALPSLEEQREITEKLNEQMREAENLKNTLTVQLEAIKKIPSALRRKAFAGEI